MADKQTRIVLDDFSGGRQGLIPPLSPDFPANGVVTAQNGDWYRTKGFRKRHGSSLLSMTGSINTGVVSSAFRHVPSTTEADAEFWTIDDSNPAVIQRLDNSATWTAPSAPHEKPDFSTEPWNMTWASFNGKLFMAFKSSAARLHVWDPATATVRRTGIAPGSTAPTVADTGVGAYAATLRYYRVRFTGAGLRSEPTPSVSFTPSGAGAAARVTRPSTPATETITAWDLEASTDNVTFYVIGQTTIGTTTFDDSFTPASYNVFALSVLTGTHTLQKAYRFIAADQGRIIGFGSYTSTDLQNAVEFGAVLGSGLGDDERVDTTVNYRLLLDEKDSGVPTGLIGPLWGNFYALKSRQIWELSPTGEADRPYRSTAISKVIGCVSAHAACIGEDAEGSPCLYTMTHRGMYRYGSGGLVYIGKGIEDLVLGPTATMNMAATKKICHMIYHADKRQLWVWFCTGTIDNDPNLLAVLDVRAGWTLFSGPLCLARCSVLFADTIGATAGFQLKPYVGYTSTNDTIIKCDDSAATGDSGGSLFQAYIETRPIEPGGPGYSGATGDLVLLAPVAAGVTITATVTPNFDPAAVKTGSVVLTAAGSETRITGPAGRLSETALSGAQFIQLRIGDSTTVANAWSIDRVTIPVTRQEAVSA